MNDIESHEKSNNVTKLISEGNSEKTIRKIDLKDPNLLDTIARQYENKVVGEGKNIKTALCSILSRDLPKDYRFSLIILNQSSTGKSYFLNNILEPFRESGDIIDFTDFTEAYFKRSQDNVNGKIIKLEQLEKRDEKGRLSLERLKHLLSEGRLRFGNVDQNEKGQRVAKTFEIVGIPVILTTATDSNIDSETENRFLVMELDESDEQTVRIVKHTLQKYSTLGNDNNWADHIKDLEKIFRELKRASHFVEEIKIPFADKLETKLPKTLTIRRDLSKILNLTCVIAFIHNKNRDKLMRKKPDHMLTSMFGDTEEIHKAIIIARPEDLQQAIEVAGKTINQTLNKTTLKSMQLFSLVKKVAAGKSLDDQGVLFKELMKETGWKESTIRDHLRTLKENGFITRDDSQKEFRYYPLEKKFSDFKFSDLIFTQEEYQEWLKEQLNEHEDSYLFVPSQGQQTEDKTEDLGVKNENLMLEIPQKADPRVVENSVP